MGGSEVGICTSIYTSRRVTTVQQLERLNKIKVDEHAMAFEILEDL